MEHTFSRGSDRVWEAFGGLGAGALTGCDADEFIPGTVCLGWLCSACNGLAMTFTVESMKGTTRIARLFTIADLDSICGLPKNV
jgi:hypothetical protein